MVQALTKWLGALVAFMIGGAVSANPQYNLTMLPPAISPQLDANAWLNQVSAAAAAINNRGTVVGSTHDVRYPRRRATVWEAGDAMDVGDLDWLTGSSNTQSQAVAINDGGQVLVSINYGSYVVVGPQGVGQLRVGNVSSINNAGVVGGSDVATRQAALWFGDDKVDLLGLGGSSSNVAAINGSGQAVGSSALPGDPTYRCTPYDGAARCTVSHAVLWTGGTATDLGTLNGVSSWALSINDAGHVVGRVAFADGLPQHSFLWNGSAMLDLGENYAEDINNLGQIVGTLARTTTRGPSGALWIDGMPVDLNSLLTLEAASSGWWISSAASINDIGQIAAGAVNLSTGESSVVLLTPVDEPPVALLLSVGLLPLLARAARRRADASG